SVPSLTQSLVVVGSWGVFPATNTRSPDATGPAVICKGATTRVPAIVPSVRQSFPSPEKNIVLPTTATGLLAPTAATDTIGLTSFNSSGCARAGTASQATATINRHDKRVDIGCGLARPLIDAGGCSMGGTIQGSVLTVP